MAMAVDKHGVSKSFLHDVRSNGTRLCVGPVGSDCPACWSSLRNFVPGSLWEPYVSLVTCLRCNLPEEETNAEETGSGDDRHRAADVYG